MKLPAVNYTDDIVIQSIVNDLIQSCDAIKNFKIVEELYYSNIFPAKNVMFIFQHLTLKLLVDFK